MDPIIDTEAAYPQIKELGLKASRRVLFDVQGQVFGASVDLLRQVPCLLSHLSDESTFKHKEPDGTVFINRSSKHFAELINIVANFQSPDQWRMPSTAQECQELLKEADFYAFPPEIIEALKEKVREQEDAVKKQISDLTAQIKALQKALEVSADTLSHEVHAKNEYSSLVADSAVMTHGCYISITDISFSLRVAKDFSKIMWSGFRSLDKVNTSPYGKAVYELRPQGAVEAGVVLSNNLKSYIFCERKIDNSASRIDLCSMGNGELLVYLETPSRSDPLSFHITPSSSTSISSSSASTSPNLSVPSSPTKSSISMEDRFASMRHSHHQHTPGFQRIICRFQADPK